MNKRRFIYRSLFYLFLIIPLNLVAQEEMIPQGKMEFSLYFSEWNGRMGNAPCIVTIKGDKIEVFKKVDSNLSGEELVVKGILIKHKSGVWVIANSESDKNAEEIGGCTGGPIPINFEKRLIEWC